MHLPAELLAFDTPTTYFALVPLEINPPVRHSSWLWLAAVVLMTGAVVCGWALCRLIRRWARDAASHADDNLQLLREQTLKQIAHVESEYRTGALGEREVRQELSAIVRRFVGIASDGDADFQTLAELERAALDDPALEPAAHFVAVGYAASFSAPGRREANPLAADGVAFGQAREVIARWK